MQIIKSSGITQDFDITKIEKVIDWAGQGLNINKQELVQELLRFIKENSSTAEIQKNLVKLAADRITTDEPDYQYLSARCAMFALRKAVYGQFEPCTLYKLIKENTDKGIYDKEILELYTKAEIDELDSCINHDLDLDFGYAGVMQLKEKYLAQNRTTGEIFETPQMTYMIMGMCLHQNEPVEKRLQYVKDFYTESSGQKISWPTPIMAGVRTPTRQFSSCVLIESGDSLASINATSDAIVNYVSKRAGIGINGGRIRAEGSQIRSGEVKHTGVIPFYKHFQTALKSCSQGGVRGGAATLYYPLWHLEVEKLLVLKNNKGVEENRIRQMDYGVQLNSLMLERLVNNDYITLFSPDIADGHLYNTYFSNPKEFKEIYEELENTPLIRKKRVKAVDLFSSLCDERASTGRIYLQFVDNVNQNSAFNIPVRQSNLCAEVILPTVPMGTIVTKMVKVLKSNISTFYEAFYKHGSSLANIGYDHFIVTEPVETDEYTTLTVEDNESSIALCTLAAFNLGKFKFLNSQLLDYQAILKTARVMVRALDNLLDYQDYPVTASLSAKRMRSLGVGVTNYAYYLAKNFTSYSDGSANELTHKTFEAIQYALLTASCELAKEKGYCKDFKNTTYSQGYLPIDRYNKNVDSIVAPVYYLDWEKLRADIKKYGLRHSTLTALMPCESSSQVSNSTNGIECPRSAVSIKQSKDGIFKMIVPDYEMLQYEYEYAWSMARQGMKGYLDLVAIMQKFVDQSISANTYYDPFIYPNDKIPVMTLIKDICYMNKMGLKTIYYQNTRDGADGNMEDEDDCVSCKI